MGPRLRWGILGTGNIARQFAGGVRASERGVLAAVGSRRAETAAAFASAQQVAVAHDFYEALLADPNVDAVYNSLPNSLHYEWTLKALRAGKHVLCEKPFANDLAQSEEMFDVAQQCGRVLAEAFMYRSHPLTHAVQAALRSGAIGELRMVRTSFLYATKNIEHNVRFNRSLGGGALMDIGCYCISYARHFAGCEPTAMHAVAKFHPRGVDEYTAGVLAFPNGILSDFACGMSVRADNTAYLQGSEGFIEVPIPWKPPVHNAAYVVVDAAGQRQKHEVSAGTELYATEANDFARSVLDGAPPAVSRSDTLGNMRVLDALRQQIGLYFP